MFVLKPADATPPADVRRAKYAVLSDSIRRRIKDGYAKPGELLPSEGDIAEMTGAARSVVRQALAVLEAEGLIDKRGGLRARVTPPQPVRAVTMARYVDEAERIRAGRPPTTSAFADGHGIAWDEYTVYVKVTRERATPKDRELLDLPAGAVVWRRSFVKYAAGVAVEIQRSAIPAFVVKKAPALADPDRQPAKGGAQQELHDAGFTVAHVWQETFTRHPDPEEKLLLKIGNVPVLDVCRVFRDRHGRKVEASRLVLPGSRHRLVDEITIGDGQWDRPMIGTLGM